MKYLVICLISITGLIFAGCSHTTELTRNTPPEDASDVNYSVTYYIHADSDYLYHAPDGTPVRDNSQVLTTAFEVAEAARSGEVFIYYQLPERKRFGLFPRKRSRFYHYLNGKLMNQVKYRYPDKLEAFLTTESQLVNRYRAQNRTNDHKNYFLYFGHEIPLENGKGYHRSVPGIDVNTVSFSRGIQNFLLTEEDRFDLVVLSTCNNGTPRMAELLMPFANVMLASPQNLHLSHVESGDMGLLEKEPGISSLHLGRSIAEKTYQKLEATVYTTVTLGLYNLNAVEDYIYSLALLTESNKDTEGAVQFQDNVDCAQIYPYEPESYRQGVETWFKPARFGRQSGQLTHSGWGCKPIHEN